MPVGAVEQDQETEAASAVALAGRPNPPELRALTKSVRSHALSPTISTVMRLIIRQMRGGRPRAAPLRLPSHQRLDPQP
jgi:hypothetical protein